MRDFKSLDPKFRSKMINMVLAANCCSVKKEEIKPEDDISLFLIAPDDKAKIILEIWEYAGLNPDPLDLEKFVFVKDIGNMLRKELTRNIKKRIRDAVIKKLNLQDSQADDYIFNESQKDIDVIDCIMDKFDISKYDKKRIKNIKILCTYIIKILRATPV